MSSSPASSVRPASSSTPAEDADREGYAEVAVLLAARQQTEKAG